jgi:uncharacterized Zn finger protein
MASSVECGECGTSLDLQVMANDTGTEPRVPCPMCGSTKRRHIVNIEEKQRQEPHTSIGLKYRRPGKKKPIREIKMGDDVHRDTGTWSYLMREIDYEHKHYVEHIVRADGTVIDTDEPLSEHQRHGSAKTRQPKRVDRGPGDKSG